MMSLSLVSSAILMGRSSRLALISAFVCLGFGLYLAWNFTKCVGTIRTIDKGLAPYRVEEEERSP
jgi:hypothetical protein